MAKLPYNEVKPKKVILWKDEPYLVLEAHVFNKQQRKPVNATKLKNLMTGKVMEVSFHQSEKIDEAEIEEKGAKYIYSRGDEHWFSDPNNPKDRFQIDSEVVGDKNLYIKEGDELSILTFNEKPIDLKLPIKVELKVTEAPPDVRGNTAQGGVKQVTLETGLSLPVPMFINEGDIIRINTETGEYADRV